MVANRYTELEKVSAVETIQNELVVSKWIEGRFISVPEKVPGTGNLSWTKKAAEKSEEHARVNQR